MVADRFSNESQPNFCSDVVKFKFPQFAWHEHSNSAGWQFYSLVPKQPALLTKSDACGALPYVRTLVSAFSRYQKEKAAYQAKKAAEASEEEEESEEESD